MTREAPRIPWGVRAAYHVAAAWWRPTLAALARRDYRGFEHLPRGGGCIVVANHITKIDPMVLGHAFYVNGFHTSFLAKDALFRPPVMGWAMHALGHIPVDRGGGGQRALEAARRVLGYGGVILIYPEGTLTRDPGLWPMAGRSGAVRLALETGAPLLPCAQWGAHRILPPYGTLPSVWPRKTVQVTCGPALDLSRYAGCAGDREALSIATEEAMDAVTQLLAGLRGETPPRVRFDPTGGKLTSAPAAARDRD
jgi:1-acyl-sn-glycerol-3-phosphate acyltransferase